MQWQERRLVVRSVAYAKAQHQALEKRLKKGQAEIAALNERRQGKKVFTDEAEMRAAGEEIVSRHRVEGLLHLECKTSVKERKVRRYGARPVQQVREQRTVAITVQVDEAALEQAKQRLWAIGCMRPINLRRS
ncbi:MAG: hypothetical protein LC674_07280 [Actinobacteria bacterium]|nr:hypothetical protein [Actinomycetota bacterium]